VELLLSHEVVEARGDDLLRSVVVRDNATGATRELEAGGLFFAIGHKPATEFLGGQLEVRSIPAMCGGRGGGREREVEGQRERDRKRRVHLAATRRKLCYIQTCMRNAECTCDEYYLVVGPVIARCAAAGGL